MEEIVVKTSRHKQAVDITGKINEILLKQEDKSGICNIFVTHTTCGLTTGEAGEGTEFSGPRERTILVSVIK